MSTRQARRRQQRVAQSRGKPVRRSATPWYFGPWGLGAALAAIAVVIILFVTLGNKTTPGVSNFISKPASASVLTTIEHPSTRELAIIGSGSLSDPFKKVSGHLALLTSGGKPVFFYFGAEFCPLCASMRWAYINALSRFGHISGVYTMLSSNTDSDPNTSTFTFTHSHYTSPYLVFAPVENLDRKRNPLQQPTPAEQAIVNKFDSTGGSVSFPFFDLANRATGSYPSGYNFEALRANPSDPNSKPLTWSQISAALSSPTNPAARNVYGNANWMTTGICKVTGNKPASACRAAPIPNLESRLKF